MSGDIQAVELYLDFTCPWSYLALERLRDVVDRNAATIVFKPVSVQELLNTENPALLKTRLAANPAKAAWQRKDLADWAAMWGLKLELPNDWPTDGRLPAAAMLIAADAGQGLEYALELYRACFGEAVDITPAVTLAKLAGKLGLDAVNFAAELKDPAWAAQVDLNTGELIRRGGFGTPSMYIDDQLFFGNDRMPLVEWTLGPISHAEFVMPGQHGKVLET